MPKAKNGWKVCSKCRELKPVSEFSKSKRNLDGLQGQCKTCKKAHYRGLKERRQVHPSEPPADSSKFCCKCKEWKPIFKFSISRSRYDGLHIWCKVCVRAYNKTYHDEIRTSLPAYPASGYKICFRCRESKAISEFPKNKSRPDGLHGLCKTCVGASNKAYNATERGKQAHSQGARQYRARKVGAEGGHVRGEFVELCEALDFRCQGCGEILSLSTLEEDHIIPLSRNGSDNINNIQPLCRSCNSSKGGKTMEEWILTWMEEYNAAAKSHSRSQ